MSDALIGTIVSSALSLLGLLFTGYIALKVASLRTDAAASDKKISAIAVTSEAVHTLVNSSMGNQLRINYVALCRVADLTGDPEDRKLAVEAEKSFHDHERKQAAVDASGAPPAKPGPEARPLTGLYRGRGDLKGGNYGVLGGNLLLFVLLFLLGWKVFGFIIQG